MDNNQVALTNNYQTLENQQNVYGNRIEPVNDPEVNRKLFSLFSTLIAPVKQIEDLEAAKNEIDRKIAWRKKFKIPRGWVIGLEALFCTVGSFFLNWLTVNTVEKIYGTNTISDLSDFYAFAKSSNNLALKIYSLDLKIKERITSLNPRSGPPKDSLGVGWLVMIIICFLICLAANLAYGFIRKAIEGSMIPALVAKKNEYTEAQRGIINSFAEGLYFVPPSYRTSDALSFFCNSYANSRVSNLQEAVQQYDLYVQHQQQMQKLDNINNPIREGNIMIANELRTLRYQNAFSTAVITAAIRW